MKTSQNGIDLIKGFEGFRAQPYRDVAGYNTVGYGHKMLPGELIDSVTTQTAEQLLADDLESAEGIINRNVGVFLNQNQFDALVSFVFNVGAGKEEVKDGFVYLKDGKPSTMLKTLNFGEYDVAADEFLKWDYAAGIACESLYGRRVKEKALFQAPVEA